MKTWTITDRRPGYSGPWDDEPDKAQWIDEATGLDCLAVRNRMGAWCGYVGVPPGHPWHGADYDAPDVDVHGGLTYAASCQEDQEHGICHVPGPGRPDDVWWLGFDCSHFGDLVPSLACALGAVGLAARRDETYKDLDYVRGEVANLAGQVAAAESLPAHEVNPVPGKDYLPQPQQAAGGES